MSFHCMFSQNVHEIIRLDRTFYLTDMRMQTVTDLVDIKRREPRMQYMYMYEGTSLENLLVIYI